MVAHLQQWNFPRLLDQLMEFIDLLAHQWWGGVTASDDALRLPLTKKKKKNTHVMCRQTAASPYTMTRNHKVIYYRNLQYEIPI